MLREPSPLNQSPVAFARQNGQKAATLTPLRFLTPLVRPYWAGLGFGGLAIMGAGGAVLALGQVFRHLIDSGLKAENLAELHHGLMQMLALVILLAVSSYARLVLLTGFAEQIMADLRAKVLGHLLHLDLPWFEKQKTGDLLSRLTADIAVLQILIGTSLPIALRNLLMVVGGVAMMTMSSPALSLSVLALVPVLSGVLFIFGPKVRFYGRMVQEKTGLVAANLAESLGAIRDIQAFAREADQQSIFALLNDHAVNATWSYVKRRALLSSLIIAVVFSGVGGLIWFGGRQVILGQISAGELSAFVFYALLVAGSVGALSEIYGDLQRASGALERIHDVLAVKPTITAPATPRVVPASGALAFNNVKFSYPARPDTVALDIPSLTINHGETVAIVGPSGSGKTTLFNLLLRFYDPQQGFIALDTIDIRQFDPASYRRYFALVPQDPMLFSTSIAENISFHDDAFSAARITEAARISGADHFIQNLPEKYQTILGERGTRLSGGQAQRLALARAVLREAKILLLDEATAHLDSETERAVQDMLRTTRHHKTTLIIAHRLSTVQHADRILVLENGVIAAQGTHAELLHTSALYQRLTQTQLAA